MKCCCGTRPNIRLMWLRWPLPLHFWRLCCQLWRVGPLMYRHVRARVPCRSELAFCLLHWILEAAEGTYMAGGRILPGYKEHPVLIIWPTARSSRVMGQDIPGSLGGLLQIQCTCPLMLTDVTGLQAPIHLWHPTSRHVPSHAGSMWHLSRRNGWGK